MPGGALSDRQRRACGGCRCSATAIVNPLPAAGIAGGDAWLVGAILQCLRDFDLAQQAADADGVVDRALPGDVALHEQQFVVDVAQLAARFVQLGSVDDRAGSGIAAHDRMRVLARRRY